MKPEWRPFFFFASLRCPAPKMKVRFWVMATDYKNYAVVWSCDPLEDCQGYRRGNFNDILHFFFPILLKKSQHRFD